MKTSILIGLSAAIFLGPANAQQTDPTPDTIACAQERGETPGRCSFSVKRGQTGKTTVTVIFENGFKRGLIFQDGAFLKASMTMSGVGKNAEWSLEDGTYIIRVDGQYYELPETVLAGD